MEFFFSISVWRVDLFYPASENIYSKMESQNGNHRFSVRLVQVDAGK